MKKRILSIALTVALLFTLIPLGAVRARAESSFVASESMIAMLKNWEGFSDKPYWDYKQWTVGYGTKVPDGNLERYQTEGIPPEEAELLLNQTLANMGKSINSFIDKFGLNLTQNQFDALLSMSFNCGTSWLYGTGYFRTAVIEGWTGSDFMFAIGQWSSAGGATQTGLIRRRQSEANMYLNGVYDAVIPSNFCYVRFEPNGGVCENKTQCYDSNAPAAIRAVPTYEGYVFEGWYTDPTGGEKVEVLDAGVRNYTLYAHWSAGDGAGLPQDNNQAEITGTPVAYDRQVATGTLNSFDKPVKGALVVESYNLGDLVAVVAEHTDSSGTKWGKLNVGGWINLGYTQEPSADAFNTTSVNVTVTGVNVNVRRGPSTAYAKVGTVTKGDQITVTHTQTGGGYTWGKFASGWIALKYTNYNDVINGTASGGNTTAPETTPPQTTPPETTPPQTTPAPDTSTNTVIATGKVKLSSGRLNVRSGASTGYPVVGRLNNGAAVQILETTTVGTTQWGRIASGWICLTYVKLDAQTDTGSQPSETTPPETTPPATTPAPDSNSGSASTAVTGTVVLTSGKLNVRSGAGTSNSIVGQLKAGTTVQITEQKTVGSKVWGKISNGWVCMDYIRVNNGNSTPSSGSNTGTGANATITAGGKLRIRSGPGTSYTIVGYIADKTRVEIMEKQTVGSTVWGRISKGWISLDFVTLDGQNAGGTAQPDNSQNTTTAKTGTITADCLRIRSAAGTSNKIVGRLYYGTKVTILETTVVDGVTWGRIDKGWISMDYVK